MKLTSFFLLLSVLFFGCFAAPALADVVPVQNASFEMTNPLNIPCGAGCAFNNGPIPDWTITGGQQGSWQPGSGFFISPLPDGTIIAYSNGGSISQTLNASLLANTTYTLSVDVGRRLDAAFLANYTISLLVGNTVLKSITASDGLIPLGTFIDVSLSYMSGATVPSGDLAIMLTNVGGGPQIDFDNVRLTDSVGATPELSSLAMLAAGLAIALFVARRR